MGGRRFIDLSISIEPDLPSDPPIMIPTVDYVDHERGGEQMKDFFPSFQKEQLPGGLGWALEFLTLTTPIAAPTWTRHITITPAWIREIRQ
ncbi:MAG: hypothetical protein SV375_15265 [Thermodesulfobacteriota bacterium]|nr:hypothetical protein [Thermodesulfobacteriota bacterium]